MIMLTHAILVGVSLVLGPPCYGQPICGVAKPLRYGHTNILFYFISFNKLIVINCNRNDKYTHLREANANQRELNYYGS